MLSREDARLRNQKSIKSHIQEQTFLHWGVCFDNTWLYVKYKQVLGNMRTWLPFAGKIMFHGKKHTGSRKNTTLLIALHFKTPKHQRNYNMSLFMFVLKRKNARENTSVRSCLHSTIQTKNSYDCLWHVHPKMIRDKDKQYLSACSTFHNTKTQWITSHASICYILKRSTQRKTLHVCVVLELKTKYKIIGF